MPIYNWNKIHETGSLAYLRKEPTDQYERTEIQEAIWDDLYNQFIDRYGLGENFKDLIRLKQRWIIQLADYIIKEDKSLLIDVEMTQADIEALMEESGSGSTYKDTMIMMEQQLGFKLDEKRLSVVDYYDYIDYFTKLSKQIKEKHG